MTKAHPFVVDSFIIYEVELLKDIDKVNVSRRIKVLPDHLDILFVEFFDDLSLSEFWLMNHRLRHLGRRQVLDNLWSKEPIPTWMSLWHVANEAVVRTTRVIQRGI